MSFEQNAGRVFERARSLIARGEAGGEWIRGSGRVETPLPVWTPGKHAIHSWFVALTADGRIAAFLELLPDLTLARFSSFQRREDSVDGCPPAEWWLDAADVRRRALERARAGETAGEPYLTFDRTPARMAWAVPLQDSGTAAETRTLFVAGRAIWEASGSEEFGGGSDR